MIKSNLLRGARWPSVLAASASLLVVAGCSRDRGAAGEVKKAPPHPAARDTYHGVVVEDPHRWLENWSDPEVRAWSDMQSAQARKYLDALPDAHQIRARLTELLSSRGTTYWSPKFRGGRLFFLKSEPTAQQPSLIWWEGARVTGQPHVVLDLDRYDATAGTSIDWYVPSPDGKLIAVSLSKGGSERGSLYVFDAATGTASEPAIANVNNATGGGDLAWTPDGSGFFYTRYPRPGEQPESELAFNQQVYFHKLGTPDAQDRYELGRDLPRIAEIRLRAQDKTGRLIAWVQNGDSGQFRFFLRDTEGHWHPFGDFKDGHFEAAFGTGDDIFVATWAGAPRGKVLRFSARDADFAHAMTVVPESDGALSHSFYVPGAPTLVVANGVLFLTYQVGGPSELRIFSAQGQRLPGPTAPALSHLSNVVPLADGTVLYALESFTRPLHWMTHSLRRQGDKELIAAPSAGWSDVEVKREFADSRDGTRVPVSILTLANVPTRGVLLTGYGGYRTPMTPEHQSEVRALLEQGVAYAVANLRGGSEFGEGWHLQGVLERKQNVFDDFIAVAEYLRGHGYAPQGRLALVGASNGGLLVGAVMTQRPDLARAIVGEVGIYDSLRNELDPNGAFNILELGTVKTPEEFKTLYAYSPYHHVRPATSYPAALFMTGANDNRVNPMHSRKMTARLQALNAAQTPILLRTSANTGHGGGTPLSAHIEAMTDEYAFVLDALGLKYQQAQHAASKAP